VFLFKLRFAGDATWKPPPFGCVCPVSHPSTHVKSAEGSFSRRKAAQVWSWPLTSIWCGGYECVALYKHSTACLHGMVLQSAQGQLSLCEFWGFPRDVAKGSIPLGYEAASMCNWIPMFQSNVMSSSSTVKTSVKNYTTSKHRDLITHGRTRHIPEKGNIFNFT
jgi:hypothetical protein